MVPVAIPTVRCHSTNSFADLLPLLPKLLYGSRSSLAAIAELDITTRRTLLIMRPPKASTCLGPEEDGRPFEHDDKQR